MNYKVEAWSWCADYCRKNQWNPHDSYFWNKANLEYRRQHNIFEVGDKVVWRKSLTPISSLMEITDLDGETWGIRHATDAEIKVGKRLEVS